MKRKFVIVNTIIGVVVLFSILLQSFHGIEHLNKFISKKKCVHQHHSKQEITHEHHALEHCFICEITFSSGISPEMVVCQFTLAFQEIPYLFSYSENVPAYFGSNYSLRGPPQFIV